MRHSRTIGDFIVKLAKGGARTGGPHGDMLSFLKMWLSTRANKRAMFDFLQFVAPDDWLDQHGAKGAFGSVKKVLKLTGLRKLCAAALLLGCV